MIEWLRNPVIRDRLSRQRTSVGRQLLSSRGESKACDSTQGGYQADRLHAEQELPFGGYATVTRLRAREGSRTD